jgi:hypothetical protein
MLAPGPLPDLVVLAPDHVLRVMSEEPQVTGETAEHRVGQPPGLLHDGAQAPTG